MSNLVMGVFGCIPVPAWFQFVAGTDNWTFDNELVLKKKIKKLKKFLLL